MFHSTLIIAAGGPTGDLAGLLNRIAQASSRPRYAFMLLSLIAEIARPDGSAGPFIKQGEGVCLLRDWLCDALAPMGARDSKRLGLSRRVRGEVTASSSEPCGTAEIEAAIESEMRERVRKSGKTNLSRAISELVHAGLIRRHYQGFRVDHQNRGGGRHAVYTLAGEARCLMARTPHVALGQTLQPVQGELRLS